MKQCPVCQNSYTDDTLQFCLEDGAALSFASGEQLTQIIPPTNNPIRVNIAQDTSPTVVARPTQTPLIQSSVERKGGSGILIGLLAAILVLVVLGSAAVIGWLLLRDTGKPEVGSHNKTQNSNTNLTVSNSSTPDDAANLRNKIANLEKQMQDQKNQKPNIPTISNTSPTTPTRISARVNSPRDGFLALRTDPSAESGERILQIPHGANVTVIACLPKGSGKRGRWCRVDYSGNIGWAYDEFLNY